MDRSQLALFVKTVPLFHHFSDAQIEEVLDGFEAREYPEGVHVFGADSGQCDLCVVVSGEFRAMLSQPELDLDVEVERFGVGECFGETAAMTGDNPFSSVVAETDGVLLRMSRQKFNEYLETSGWFAKIVCRTLAERVNTSMQRLGSVPFIKLQKNAELSPLAPLLPGRVCKACRCLVLSKEASTVTVGLVDPSDANTRSFVAAALAPWDVSWAAISQEDFELHAHTLYQDRPDDETEITPFDSLACINPSGEQSPVSPQGGSDQLRRLLSHAIRCGASDVHFEPGHDAAVVRMRVDGRMRVVDSDIPPAEMRQMTTQIKVMCELDITRMFAPRDGNCTLIADGKRIDARVSTLPCHGGEKVVMRLVAPQSHFGRLSNLVLAPGLSELVRRIVHSPNGLVLVTGPTGSGKTTTLYAALQSLWQRDQSINIVTIEDPIEYNLPFATQVQINAEHGLTFSNVLRSVLRQDPDVVLVGEIRDRESAALAVEAATTGHLVLSSLHTRTAVETLARMRQLGVPPFLLADALRGVITQKLVLRMPPGSGEPVPAQDEAVYRLKAIGVLPQDWGGEMRRPKADGDSQTPSEQGRVGLFEVLSVSNSVKDRIEQGASSREVYEALEPNDFTPFAAYARYLLESGLVSPEQVERLFPRAADISSDLDMLEWLSGSNERVADTVA